MYLTNEIFSCFIVEQLFYNIEKRNRQLNKSKSSFTIVATTNK